MLKELANKVTRGMIWLLISSIAVSIVMVALAYTYVVLHSDQIAYEGVFGKFSAKISSIQTQLNNALETNKELTSTVENLKHSMEKLRGICMPSALQALPDNEAKLFTDKFIDINGRLKTQSFLLNQQKKELNLINEEILQFKNELQMNSNNHLHIKK